MKEVEIFFHLIIGLLVWRGASSRKDLGFAG